MNDVERYEYAEKLIELYHNTPKGGINEDVFKDAFGDEEPSAEDQELILKMVKDLIDHEREESDYDENEEDADESADRVESPKHYSLKAETAYTGAKAGSLGSSTDQVAEGETVV